MSGVSNRVLGRARVAGIILPLPARRAWTLRNEAEGSAMVALAKGSFSAIESGTPIVSAKTAANDWMCIEWVAF